MHGSGGWLSNVPDQAVTVIRTIAPASTSRHDTAHRRGWWVRCQPSTLLAREVTLLRRNERGRVVFELDVLHRGVLCDQALEIAGRVARGERVWFG